MVVVIVVAVEMGNGGGGCGGGDGGGGGSGGGDGGGGDGSSSGGVSLFVIIFSDFRLYLFLVFPSTVHSFNCSRFHSSCFFSSFLFHFLS